MHLALHIDIQSIAVLIVDIHFNLEKIKPVSFLLNCRYAINCVHYCISIYLSICIYDKRLQQKQNKVY